MTCRRMNLSHRQRPADFAIDTPRPVARVAADASVQGVAIARIVNRVGALTPIWPRGVHVQRQTGSISGLGRLRVWCFSYRGRGQGQRAPCDDPNGQRLRGCMAARYGLGHCRRAGFDSFIYIPTAGSS